MSSRSVERVFVAGIPVIREPATKTATYILDDAKCGCGRAYLFVNAHSAKLRREAPEYAAALADRERTIAVAAGPSVYGAARLLGHGPIGHTPQSALLGATCAACAASGIPMFFMGGHERVAARLAWSLQGRHPGLKVVGTVAPPFGEWTTQESRSLVEAVRASGAKLLWLGVSSPSQEVWAYTHAAELGIPIVCVGAAFSSRVLAKAVPHPASRFVVDLAYGMRRMPTRLWRRNLVGSAVFLADVLRYRYRLAPVR
ncbi:MAG: WecB/TagA/CpsF family glycosyltransferase [Coriobacteriia bacterium]